MDADWVILSACNRAGPQSENAQALPGIVAGLLLCWCPSTARVSLAGRLHAALKLTTRPFEELKAHPNVGRAEAFRVSMKELIQKGTIVDAHPSQWAPFVIVGEGG
jgi:CHAT domain-containing protein